MKFLCISDLHLTKKRPINRLDEDYWLTSKDKLDFVLSSFIKYKCDTILCGGDLLDSHIVSNEIKSYLIQQKNGILYNHAFITTLGQHCLLNRNLTKDCSIHLLNETQTILILSQRARYSFIELNENICIYGCGYQEEIPKIIDPNAFNILLIHALVSDKDYWSGNVKWMSTKWLFRNTKFDLIVTGDNHISFQTNREDRWLLNSGSMMRKTVAQEDHKPCFFIVDVDENKKKITDVEQIFIPVKPFSDIMKIDEHRRKKELQFDDAKWREELTRKDFSAKVNFKEDLLKEADELEDEETKSIVYECVENV